MRKYVSLGAALMMGTVIGKEKKTNSVLQHARAVPQDVQHATQHYVEHDDHYHRDYRSPRVEIKSYE